MMISSQKGYAVIPQQEGGWVLAEFEIDPTVEPMRTPDLKEWMEGDASVHFVSFALGEISGVFREWNGSGSLDTVMRKRLVPIGVWGSQKTGQYGWMYLDGRDIREFEKSMTIKDAYMQRMMVMDGLGSMGGHKRWFSNLKMVKAVTHNGATRKESVGKTRKQLAVKGKGVKNECDRY